MFSSVCLAVDYQEPRPTEPFPERPAHPSSPRVQTPPIFTEEHPPTSPSHTSSLHTRSRLVTPAMYLRILWSHPTNTLSSHFVKANVSPPYNTYLNQSSLHVVFRRLVRFTRVVVGTMLYVGNDGLVLTFRKINLHRVLDYRLMCAAVQSFQVQYS